jgi:hypothetical protein
MEIVMANPDSLLTRFLWKLAAWIQPVPDMGEGWCLRCSLNNGKATVIDADFMQEHVGLHFAVDDPKHEIRIVTRKPPRKD